MVIDKRKYPSAGLKIRDYLVFLSITSAIWV